MQTKQLIAVALATLAAGSAQAARWELVDNGTAFDLFDLAADFSGGAVGLSGSAADLSGAGYALWSGDGFTDVPLATGGASAGYASTLAVDTQGGSASAAVSLGGSHVLSFDALDAGSVSGYQVTQDLAVTGLKLRIVGDAGEADGTPVTVSFSGSADALFDFGLPADPLVGLDLQVDLGGNVVAAPSFVWSADGRAPVAFSFAAAVGDVLDLTLAFHAEGTQAGSFAYVSGEQLLGSASAQLDGQLLVAAVPEPQTYAMLLAGLGLLGIAARRRRG